MFPLGNLEAAATMPAQRAPGIPPAIRARLDALRAEAFARYAEQVRRAPDVWHW